MAGRKALGERIHAIPLAGRLRGTEARAVALVHASCIGVVLSLLADADLQAHPHLSVDAREAALTAITGIPPSTDDNSVKGAATTLRARLSQSTNVLTRGEFGLLDEFLLRLSNAAWWRLLAIASLTGFCTMSGEIINGAYNAVSLCRLPGKCMTRWISHQRSRE